MVRRWLVLAYAVLLVVPLALALIPTRAIAPTPAEVAIVELDRNIDAGAEELVRRAASYAKTRQGVVSALVLWINTDGGYVRAMQSILDMLAELDGLNVTTAALVAPSGARCRSAGAYIFMACDVTAMAHGSSIGACMPVDLMGNPADEKVINALAAQMEGLAEAKGRNTTAAREMVVRNAAFTAGDAKNNGVCDMIVTGLDDLLDKLGLKDATRVFFEPDFHVEFLSFISNPLIQSLLMWAATLIILINIFEPTPPLLIIGLAMLAIALWGAGVMGASPLAIALVVLGSVLIVLELEEPGVGLELVGIVLVVLGILFAYHHEPFIAIGGVEIAIMVTALAGGGILAYYLFSASRALRGRPRVHEPERLVGLTGVAKTDIRPGEAGVVLVEAETWTATSEEEIPAGARVRIISVEGLTLKVEKEG